MDIDLIERELSQLKHKMHNLLSLANVDVSGMIRDVDYMKKDVEDLKAKVAALHGTTDSGGTAETLDPSPKLADRVSELERKVAEIMPAIDETRGLMSKVIDAFNDAADDAGRPLLSTGDDLKAGSTKPEQPGDAGGNPVNPGPVLDQTQPGSGVEVRGSPAPIGPGSPSTGPLPANEQGPGQPAPQNGGSVT
jgi:hypothetical protein